MGTFAVMEMLEEMMRVTESTYNTHRNGSNSCH
jgi:hypothetical protein